MIPTTAAVPLRMNIDTVVHAFVISFSFLCFYQYSYHEYYKYRGSCSRHRPRRRHRRRSSSSSTCMIGFVSRITIASMMTPLLVIATFAIVIYCNDPNPKP